MNRRQNAGKPYAPRIWVVRSGGVGAGYGLFLREGVIALADAGMGDLTKLKGGRESFYAAYRRANPKDTKVGSAGIAGKFFRFTHEVKVGDLAVYPAVQEKTFYIGDILSHYAFDTTSPYPHRRLVQWKFMIPNSKLSQTSRYELGAARTFFEFKKNAEELFSLIADETVTRFRLNEMAK